MHIELFDFDFFKKFVVYCLFNTGNLCIQHNLQNINRIVSIAAEGN